MNEAAIASRSRVKRHFMELSLREVPYNGWRKRKSWSNFCVKFQNILLKY
jgi:hypothetical protein